MLRGLRKRAAVDYRSEHAAGVPLRQARQARPKDFLREGLQVNQQGEVNKEVQVISKHMPPSYHTSTPLHPLGLPCLTASLFIEPASYQHLSFIFVSY